MAAARTRQVLHFRGAVGPRRVSATTRQQPSRACPQSSALPQVIDEIGFFASVSLAYETDLP